MGDRKRSEAFNEKAFANKKLLWCYTIISMVLFVAYLLELVKGNRTFGYVCVFSAILLTPLAISILLYRKNEESDLVRKVAAYGYGLLYAFVLWTTVSNLAFTYILPMLLAISMYQDKKYTLRVGIGGILVNMVYIAMRFASGGVDSGEIVNIEIQMAVMLLIVSFSYVTTNTLGIISDHKMGLIEAEKEKVDGMTNDASELIMQIKEQFGETIEITREGNGNMMELQAASESSREVGREVNRTMTDLVEKTQEAKEILGMIDGITKQTAMLALNASIEAARAGEAGAGFAVVADQIKKLAEETQKATENISNIVGSLANQADKAGNSVNSLLSTNENQMELVEQTKASFDKIKTEINQISEKIDQEYTYMEKVTTSNNEINQHVERLSAFSEELLANTENTQELSDQTIQGTESINGLLDNVMAEVQGLQTMIEHE